MNMTEILIVITFLILMERIGKMRESIVLEMGDVKRHLVYLESTINNTVESDDESK